MRKPRFSIVMNCLNSAAYLREAIDSIYAQSFEDWEVIFVDNDSTDESAEIAKSYGEKIRYFKLDKTVPLGEARNYALARCDGEFIAFLDCDDYWMPDKLALQLSSFERNENVGVVFSDACDLYPNGKTIRHFRNIRIKPRRGRVFGYLLKNYYISMPTVVLRRKALEAQREWFDPTFQICTDYDLFLRIAHDWECDYLEQPLATYRIHASSSTDRYFARLADELLTATEKIRRIYPDTATVYSRSLEHRMRTIHFQVAKRLWRQSCGRKSRQILAKHLLYPKFAVTFLLTFVSYTSFSAMLLHLKQARMSRQSPN